MAMELITLIELFFRYMVMTMVKIGYSYVIHRDPATTSSMGDIYDHRHPRTVGSNGVQLCWVEGCICEHNLRARENVPYLASEFSNIARTGEIVAVTRIMTKFVVLARTLHVVFHLLPRTSVLALQLVCVGRGARLVTVLEVSWILLESARKGV
ncbi:hypothetical protein PM082_007568 [Marasmius tenuissimus]|nr:hypothetical protein PM082_007568 [Marasmius tenuissimus]